MRSINWSMVHCLITSGLAFNPEGAHDCQKSIWMASDTSCLIIGRLTQVVHSRSDLIVPMGNESRRVQSQKQIIKYFIPLHRPPESMTCILFSVIHQCHL